MHVIKVHVQQINLTLLRAATVPYFLFVEERHLLQYSAQWNPDFLNLQAKKNGLS